MGFLACGGWGAGSSRGVGGGGFWRGLGFWWAGGDGEGRIGKDGGVGDVGFVGWVEDMMLGQG